VTDLERLTATVVAFRDAREWKQFHNPKDVALSLLLEAGELLEIFQWQQGEAIAATAQQRRQDVADELADVLCYTLLLAHDQGIDLSDALAAKMEKNARKYPVEQARGSSRKAAEP
jgi:dCTP diphosphatase